MQKNLILKEFLYLKKISCIIILVFLIFMFFFVVAHKAIAQDLLDGVWGASGSDMFVVGGQGVIFHYEDYVQSPMDSNTTTWLHDVWGSSASDVFAVGHDGIILHYDGNLWLPMDSNTTDHLYSVWGSSGNKVFAVGGNSAGTEQTIHYYDGNSWSMNFKKTGDPNANEVIYLSDIWGNSQDDILTVGTEGTILHYDGSQWLPMDSNTSDDLNGVWGSLSSGAFAVGGNNITQTIYYFDGNSSSWSLMHSQPGYYLTDVWGSSKNNVFAVGTEGTILYYDGNSWSTMYSGTTNWLMGIWGTSENNVFVVGNGDMEVYRYNGNQWSPIGFINNFIDEGKKGCFITTCRTFALDSG